jgi:hypothetical protein
LLGVVLALAVLGAACGSGSADSTAPSVNPFDIAPGDGVVARSMAGELSVEVGGAIEAAWSGTTAIQILTSVSAEIPESAWLLNVGLLDPVEPAGGPSIRPAFDLLGYGGAGDYTIGPPSAEVGPEDPATALQSDAFLVIGSSGGEGVAYAELLEPCALTVERTGEAGHVSCPRVSGPAGEISFMWSWDAQELLSQEGGPTGATPGAGEGVGQPGPEPDGGQAAREQSETENSMPLAVTLEPACVRPGGQATAEVTTEPHGSLAMAVAFEDARTYGLHMLATADDEGRFTWTFVVPPDAPDGPGHFLVSAGSADGERAGKHVEDFEVRLTGC